MYCGGNHICDIYTVKTNLIPDHSFGSPFANINAHSNVDIPITENLYLYRAALRQPHDMADLRFLHPEFLYALSLLAIPIIVHLFNFRRFRKVPFTNVRFLREITEETSSRSKLKHLLTLLSRLLIFTFIILAFAQPYLPLDDVKLRKGGSAVSIFLDNSFSMEASTPEGTLLDVSRERARQVITSFKPTDKFQVLSNDFEPSGQRLYTQEEALDRLEKIKVGSHSRSLSDILNRQTDMLTQSDAGNRYAFIISDFQKSLISDDEVVVDSSIIVSAIMVSAEKVPNVSVDSVWFSTPALQKGQPAELNVLLKGYSVEEQDMSVSLIVDGVQRAIATAEVIAGSESVVSMTFTPEISGWHKGEVTIDDSPIRFDNDLYFSFRLNDKVNVLSLSGKDSASQFLEALYGSNELVEYSKNSFSTVDYSSLPQFDMIVLDRLPEISSGLSTELSKFVQSGKTLVIFPDSAAIDGKYSGLAGKLQTESLGSWRTNDDRVEKLNTEDQLFEGVFEGGGRIGVNTDLPVISGSFTLDERSAIAREELMTMASGEPFLVRYPVEKGNVYLFTVPLDQRYSNFGRHALFVPVMFRIAMLSHGVMPLFHMIGEENVINAGSGGQTKDRVLNLVNRDLGFDIIPLVRSDLNHTAIMLNDEPSMAANYDLIEKDSLIQVVSMNFNRRESVADYFDQDELELVMKEKGLNTVRLFGRASGELKSFITSGVDGIRLWKYCVILALTFLVMETLLLRFFKT